MNFVPIKFDRRIKAFKTAINQAKDYQVFGDDKSEAQSIVSPSGSEYKVSLKMTKKLEFIGNCECKAFVYSTDFPCKHCYIVAFYTIKDWLMNPNLNSGYNAFLDQHIDKLSPIPFLQWNLRKSKPKTTVKDEIIDSGIEIAVSNTPKIVKQALAPRKQAFVTPIGDIPQDFIVKIAGKPYIRKAGLIFVAKKNGLKSIETEPIQWSHESREQRSIFKAKVTFDDGSHFEGYGVADSENVKASQFLPHLDHLAETRAVCRALRNATASGLVAIEEMSEPTTKELE